MQTASAAAGTAAALAAGVSEAVAAPRHQAFLHSVASGDPLPDRVILWTRVTPEPRATPGSGFGQPTNVRWQVSVDPGFTRIV